LRSDLNAILAAGPAALLAHVLTEPVKNSGAFVGFKITRFTHGNPPIIDLRTGDVILLVNGKKVERPEDYFIIFEELKVAREINFLLLRENKEISLSYPVIE